MSEAGDALSPQIIFGGKSAKTFKNAGAVPNGWLVSYSDSHWQTKTTYIDYVSKIIVPHKNEVIRRLHLPNSQKMVLIHDLHFTHVSPELNEYLRDNGIVPVTVPATCTDELQVCDICVNKPFKMAAKRAFREYCHRQFNAHIAAGESAHTFQMVLGIGTMKPHLVSFVQRGLDALRSQDLRGTIRRTFQADSPGARLAVARETNYINAARERRRVAMPIEPIEPVQDDNSQNVIDSDVESIPLYDKQVIEDRLVLRLRLTKRNRAENESEDESSDESDDEDEEV